MNIMYVNNALLSSYIDVTVCRDAHTVSVQPQQLTVLGRVGGTNISKSSYIKCFLSSS